MKYPDKPTILITGALGFIGQALQKVFADINIITLDKREGADVKANLSDTLYWTPSCKIDAIIHLAGISGVRETEDFGVNVRIIDNVTKWADKNNVKFLINASSSSVYGNQMFMRENVPPLPISDYGKSKVDVEDRLSTWAEKSNSTAFSLRLFNAIGENQRHTMFPYLIVEAMKTGFPLPVYGTRYRAWTYVDDIANAFWSVYDKFKHGIRVGDHTISNFGSTNSLSQMDLIKIFFKFKSQNFDVKYLPPLPIEVNRTKADMNRFQSLFGWSPNSRNIELAVTDLMKQNGLIG